MPSEMKFFLKHTPTGIPAHLTLGAESSADELKTLLANINVALGWLADQGFEGHWGGEQGARPNAPAAADVPKCPQCAGEMWDNRKTKTNPRAPDFKCKDKECGAGVWPEKK